MTYTSVWYENQYDVDDGARGIVEMLFCTSLLALVGAADQPQSSPRKLQIVNTKVRRLCICLWFIQYSTASINDLRTPFPFVYTCRQAQPKDSRYCS